MSGFDRWQGIEHEFRVGINAGATELYRYARYYHVDEIIRSLEEYKFFDDVPAICSKLQRRNDGFLRNGARIYVCTGGHLEIATPECRNAFEVLKYDKASEIYMQLGAELASERYRERFGKRGGGDDIYIQCWKANVEIDKRYSRGTHESYMVERRKFAGKEGLFIPYLVLRKVFCGAGGYILDSNGVRYVISPKAVVARRVMTESPSQWPILSTRDEPLTSKDKMRVHVTSGEGLRSEVTRLLNNAITTYVIDAIENGIIRDVPDIWNPLQTFKEISQNINGDWKIRLANGDRIKVLDYLNHYYIDAIEELFEERETDYWDEYALKTFKRVCEKLDQGLLEDPYLVRRIEWIMKLWVVEHEIDDFEYSGRHLRSEYYMIDDETEKKIAASFAFTNLCEYDLYEKVADKIGVERILTEEDIAEALLFPPKNSRAELRVRLAQEFKNATISWNKITITKEPKIRIDVRRPGEDEYSQLFSRYPELARMPSVVVVFLGERRRGSGAREVLVRLLAEEEDVRHWEERISREIRERISRNPYLDYLLYSGSRTYRFDELDGWDEESIRRKIEEIKREEAEAEAENEEEDEEEGCRITRLSRR
ncbi:MAG: hypothetical protein OD814_001678 [Candidatus Alkanophagales archaeon MCA70_species_1]|nr:hypothetical protein [Candidatus Alkanophaga volatiphilum]